MSTLVIPFINSIKTVRLGWLAGWSGLGGQIELLIRSLYIFVRNENGIGRFLLSRGKLSDRRKPRVNKEINASFHYRASRSGEGDGTIVRLIDRGRKGGGRERSPSAHRGLAKYLLE